MPNHYTNVIIIVGGHLEESPYEVDWKKILRPYYEGPKPKNLLSELLPMPEEVEEAPNVGANPLWRQWALANWGTKWGLYGAGEPVRLPGDCLCTMWPVQSAWGAPNQHAREVVAAWLRGHGADDVRWIGVDPYDDSVRLLSIGVPDGQ